MHPVIFLSYENKRGAIIYEKKNIGYSSYIAKRVVLIELAHLTKKYGIEIATSKMDLCTVFKRSVTESKIGKGLQYDKYDDEYIIEN